jgi:iron complex outermembrane receptor protein
LNPADALESHAAISSYDSEKTSNYEAGLKSSLLDNRMRLNVAGFYTSYENRLFTSINASLEEVTRNVGTSHNYGFEADLKTSLTSELVMGISYGTTVAKWNHIPGYFNPNTGATIDLHGLTAPFVPRYQAALSFDWSHRFSNGMSFGARVDSSFTGSQYWNISDDYRQQAYNVVNVGVRLDISKQWQLAANVRNLFDEQYNTVFASGPDIGSPRNTAGFSRPRQWFASATFKL